MQVITYHDDAGNLVIVAPALGLDPAQVAAKDVPTGKAWQIVDASTLPPFPSPPPAKPSPREWLERLPQDRQQAIIDAAFAAGGLMRLWIIKALGSGFIDVTAEETITGVNSMRFAGVLVSDAERDTLLSP